MLSGHYRFNVANILFFLQAGGICWATDWYEHWNSCSSK